MIAESLRKAFALATAGTALMAGFAWGQPGCVPSSSIYQADLIKNCGPTPEYQLTKTVYQQVDWPDGAHDKFEVDGQGTCANNHTGSCMGGITCADTAPAQRANPVTHRQVFIADIWTLAARGGLRPPRRDLFSHAANQPMM
jgi:hypothetical protein